MGRSSAIAASREAVSCLLSGLRGRPVPRLERFSIRQVRRQRSNAPVTISDYRTRLTRYQGVAHFPMKDAVSQPPGHCHSRSLVKPRRLKTPLTNTTRSYLGTPVDWAVSDARRTLQTQCRSGCAGLQDGTLSACRRAVRQTTRQAIFRRRRPSPDPLHPKRWRIFHGLRPHSKLPTRSKNRMPAFSVAR